jgi:hypothetical protein
VKEIVASLSFGDQITSMFGDEPLLNADSFRKAFRAYREAGVATILFRIDGLDCLTEFTWPEPNILYKGVPKNREEVLHLEELQKQWEGMQLTAQRNLLPTIIGVAHEYGMNILSYRTMFDEGMPLDEVWYRAGEKGKWLVQEGRPWHFVSDWSSPMIAHILETHPQYMMVDRSQKVYNWGTLEFAYPGARHYGVRINQGFLDNYEFDGCYIDFRNEFSHPEFGDQFGFSPPIVEEFQRRHGLNILREQFDLELWRRLCGEYLTQFIREMHAMTSARGKTLVVGIPQGNYMGLPNGNRYLDWPRWVSERLVEGLLVGSISGQFIFPDRVGYGYLTDMETGIGLPNLLWDLDNHYWPHCALHETKLYAIPKKGPWYRGPDFTVAQLSKTRVDGVVIGHHVLVNHRQ